MEVISWDECQEQALDNFHVLDQRRQGRRVEQISSHQLCLKKSENSRLSVLAGGFCDGDQGNWCYVIEWAIIQTGGPVTTTEEICESSCEDLTILIGELSTYYTVREQVVTMKFTQLRAYCNYNVAFNRKETLIIIYPIMLHFPNHHEMLMKKGKIKQTSE